MSRVLAVIQARLGSSRLPAKVLAPLGDEGRPVLDWVVRAVAACRTVDQIVVATTTLAEDDAVVAAADQLGVAAHRGPVDDVLTRFLGALDAHPADWLLRVTSDCPLADPAVMDRVVEVATRVPDLAYVTTALTPTLPRGLDAEVVRADALRAIDPLATGFHRAHVTSRLTTDPGGHEVLGLAYPVDAAHLRVTLDTADDLALLRAATAALGDRVPSWREVVDLLAARPDLVALNAHVRQKELALG